MPALISQTLRKLRRGVRLLGLPLPVAKTLVNVQRARLTFLREERLLSLARLALEMERHGRAGKFLEAGCALGGSAILLATAKSKTRALDVYDVFGLIPPPGEKDGEDAHQRFSTIVSGQAKGFGGDTYYGYQDDLCQRVQQSFASFRVPVEENSVRLIRGLVQDTLQVDGPVALAHIDVDWYEPVMACLTRIWPKLVAGGAVVLDDYQDWSGCRRATDEFLAGLAPESYSLDLSCGHAILRRR